MANASEHDLDPNTPYRDAMRGLIAARFGIMWKAVPIAIEGSDPEGVHDVRVASRRLRAAMDVAVGCFPDSWYRPLHDIVKEITSELGEVRDRDVMLEFLSTERKRASSNERVGIDRLIQRVTRERDSARELMLAFLSTLETDDVAGQAVRRFGPDAAAPWSNEDST
jgi:triphosphatase